ncbi:gluconokinase [Paucibacter sp. PLA-PC-4]|uniref:gluconokinase n=1 Tax=Paucibacter sp. PLA-PC-4 TaxID=2993655 RepID=UPI0022494EAF|nr:gluconokinase [Paucibacter sp. PLA-PC-4]MCX2861623.1 gluconokinase [Paucibacter sp. PLA-PC-4]
MSKAVVMGVAGCGKSSLGQAIAAARGWAYIEGDAHHSPASVAKMRAGIALTDADREGWLDLLGRELAAQHGGTVLACSALKLSYRERLRAAVPGLRFVFLDISRELSLQRVTARAAEHLFPASLVDSQFAALESPLSEAGVLRVAAAATPEQQLSEALAWLQGEGT